MQYGSLPVSWCGLSTRCSVGMCPLRLLDDHPHEPTLASNPAPGDLCACWLCRFAAAIAAADDRFSVLFRTAKSSRPLIAQWTERRTSNPRLARVRLLPGGLGDVVTVTKRR